VPVVALLSLLHAAAAAVVPTNVNVNVKNSLRVISVFEPM